MAVTWPHAKIAGWKYQRGWTDCLQAQSLCLQQVFLLCHCLALPVLPQITPGYPFVSHPDQAVPEASGLCHAADGSDADCRVSSSISPVCFCYRSGQFCNSEVQEPKSHKTQ